METDYIFNEHNKEEFPPAHTAEHLLNQLMGRIFGAERSNIENSTHNNPIH